MSVVSSVEAGARRVTDRLEVVRWSRYGKRRLYVNTPVGTPVGWVDLNTGERWLALPDLAAAFETAIADLEAAIPAPYTPRRALDQVRVNAAPRYALEPLA